MLCSLPLCLRNVLHCGYLDRPHPAYPRRQHAMISFRSQSGIRARCTTFLLVSLPCLTAIHAPAQLSLLFFCLFLLWSSACMFQCNGRQREGSIPQQLSLAGAIFFFNPPLFPICSSNIMQSSKETKIRTHAALPLWPHFPLFHTPADFFVVILPREKIGCVPIFFFSLLP
ncbi:hypothetical protein EDD21DRAFT_374705 [Dissophora ornata]|nr:hypothetical protein EDD21DRAFT_374705 [Dissophora ornata]